jgi:hypothetical protein
MKYLLSLILLALSFQALAGDSGLYFDQSRDGEGIVLMRDKTRYVFYFFTYGADGCTDEVDVGPKYPYSCDLDGQRWFLSGGDEINEKTQQLEGFLYITRGLDYPNGIQDPEDPFSVQVGEAETVGFYILKRSGDGWRLFVARFGDELAPDDYIYSRVFNFEQRLLQVNE